MNSSDAISMYTKSYNYNQSVDVSNKTDNDSAVRAEVTAFIREVNYWIGIIEICMVVFGVIGNTLALIIINRPSLRNTSSSVFITYLAIFDSLVLIVHLTGLILLSRIKFYILHCLITFLADFVTFCSVWIMVIMTLERCIAIHSPLLAKRLCTVERTRHAMYSLIVFALIVFSATLPIVYTRNLNQTKCLIRPEYQTLLRILKPTTFYFIPDILLLVNIFIIYELFMARRYRTQKLINPENAMSQINAASFNRKQQQLTLMLVTVSLSFYIFSTPTVIDYILQGKPPDHKDPKRLKILILRSNLTVLWVQMSSATNFLFYYVAGSKFRSICVRTVMDIYQCIRAKLDENYQRPRSSSTQTIANFCIELRDDAPVGIRNRTRSTSVQKAVLSYLNNSPRRVGHDTQAGSQVSSRRPSKGTLTVQEF